MTDFHSLLNEIDSKLGINTILYSNQNGKSNTFNVRSNNYIKNSGSVNNEKNDINSRNALEKEMEPYLKKMKNELNIMMQHYRREIGDNIYIQPKIKLLEEEINENKKYIELFKNDYNKKMLEFNNVILDCKLKVENFSDKIDDMNKKFKLVENANNK